MTDPRLSSGDFRGSYRSAYIDLSRESDFALGNALVRPALAEVSVGGQLIRIQPRVMQVLVALARTGGEVVSRDQLVASCWGGVAIGDDAINRCIGQLRRLAETEAPGSFDIVTLPRIGYRLVAGERRDAPALSTTRVSGHTIAAELPVEDDTRRESTATPRRSMSLLWWWLGASAAVAALGAALLIVLAPRAEPPPRLYTIAVLPIRNLTGDRSLDPAADKLTEDVAHVLGRGGYLFVAPRDATFAWKGRPVDDRLLGKMLHVRHIVNASLRKSGSDYRVNYQIVDTTTDVVVDSQDIGQPAADGALPEHVLAMTMFEEITDVLQRRWSAEQLAKPPDDHDPDNVLARLEKLLGAGGRANIAQVERLTKIADSAISMTNALRPAFDMDICWYYANLVDHRAYTSPGQRLAWATTALNAAGQAEELKPHSTSPHACRAETLGLLGRWDEGVAEARFIVDNFPLTVVGYEALANLDLERGHFREALNDFTELTRRIGGGCEAELGEAGGCHGELGLVHLFLGENDAALTELREQEVEEPKSEFPPFFLTAALEQTGAHDEALASASLYRRLKTDNAIWRMLALSNMPAFLAPAQTIRAALHNAGLDEPAGSAR